MSELQKSGAGRKSGRVSRDRIRAASSGGQRDEKRPMRVLIVNDEPDAAEEWRGLLSEEPAFRCEIAWRLSTALTLLETVSFDVVLLDPDLPDSQGVESARKVRAHSPSVAILVAGTARDSRLVVAYTEAGAQDLMMAEELEAKELIRRIRAITGKNPEKAAKREPPKPGKVTEL